MTLHELQIELFDTITEYLDVHGLGDYSSDIADIVGDIFDSNFYPATITELDIVSKPRKDK